MKRIKIVKLSMENFKGVSNRTIDFTDDKTTIKGQNASGKTTIADAFMWLMFGKNYAGESKFQIRPLDIFNNVINNIDIKVVAGLEIDGKPVCIEKMQRQVWVTKRGSSTKELQGNENTYKVNSVPMKENEYKKYISDIVDEDLFRLLTNPMEFTSLKWKDQRATLLSMVDPVDNDEIFAMDQQHKFDNLKLALSLHTEEENMAIANDALKGLKKEQTELPARIDALNKARTDIDVAEQELAKADYERQIKELDTQLEQQEVLLSSYNNKSDEIMQKKFKANDLKRTEMDKLLEQKRTLQRQVDDKDREFTDAFESQTKLEHKISEIEENIASLEKHKAELAEQWKIEKATTFDDSKWVFDETSLNCALCGQPLPTDKQSEIKEQFEERKAGAIQQFEVHKKIHLDAITSDGNDVAERIKEQQKAIEIAKTDIEHLKTEKETSNAEKNALQKQLDNIPDEMSLDVSMNGDAEYMQLIADIDVLEKDLASMNSGADFRSQLKIKRNGLAEQLDAVNKIIASADNSKIDEQIVEYEARQKEVGQLVADQEQLIYLLEEFNRTKMNMLSSKINAKFKVVSWKLFDKQLNGGIKECCECMVNGIPFSNVNSGHKIVAGMDIINTLIGLHEVSCPIFIDNAETINNFNLPEIDAQLILLKVSDDKEIVVESEE